ncbi:TIGR01212 family radical SAM protein [Fusobacterium pseudoperiodonticum]|uniref:TIGR01212 family radical SAM protein n=1 Tax=Fusobacterium pseudoperiodonticum TaxID=2663009 RepID=A0AAD0F2V5_9FUSO|nr:TIGR01212 family radical SAM protein [Fusobacterium pseudoperiodonticum]ATV35073.1 TIGR01212 family radical SAM protein [Fusobacterium pseudoperiodonticum]ATV62033.1 TIGR01212 family radical SAM protein [Fusobacterium pseudoperiodonticum]
MIRKIYMLNDFLKEKFNEKIYKVSLDGGFTCPNRDGKVSRGGCIFCSENGSGDFTATKLKSIHAQIEEQIDLVSKKYKGDKYIAYFQNFTNTYAEVSYLRKIYEEALSHEKIVGLAIATRPDCLEDDVLELLAELNKKTFLWVELGLQTLNDDVAKYFNRAYETEIYKEASEKLNRLSIKFVTHIIIGLPKEENDDYLKTAIFAQNCGTWGIKLHLMYVVKNTPLEKLYLNGDLKVNTKEEYVEKVVNVLENISSEIVVHRLTGDGDRETLVAPLWSIKKIDVLNSIHKELKRRNTYQGKLYYGGLK